MTARKPRRATASRTRKVTVEETETLTVEEPTADLPVVRAAPGFEVVKTLTPADIRRQRELQRERTLLMVAAQAQSGDPHDDRHIVQTAANLLRAGPGAGAMQQLYGRY